MLGLALTIHNTVTLERSELGSAPDRCSVHGPESRLVPTTADSLVLVAARAVFTRAEVDPGALHATIDQHVPVSSGMGSSSAALAGGAAAANALLDDPLPEAVLVGLLAELEGHAEQPAAALLGGLVAAVTETSGAPRAIPMPIADLHFAAVTPALVLETKRARAVLPDAVPLCAAVAQLGNVVALLEGLATGDRELLRAGTRDHLHQDPRSALLPVAPHVLTAGLDAGALASCWSGAGPTMLALCATADGADRAGVAMRATFEEQGIRATVRHCTVDHHGTVEI